MQVDSTPVTASSQQRSLRSRLGLNMLGYGYGQLVTLATQLLVVPFFLAQWGTDAYADWLVIAGIPMLLSFIDLGVAQASASRATMFAARNDVSGVQACMQTAFAFVLAVIAVLIVAGVGLGAKVDWSRLLGLQTMPSALAGQVVALLAIHLCTSLWANCLDAWFRAADRTPLGAFLLANRGMIDVVVSLTVLLTGGGPGALAITLAGAQVAMAIAATFVAMRVSPWPVLGFARASRAEFRSVVVPALSYLGFPLSQIITIQGTLQIINQLASPSIVVAFTMARTLMRLCMQIGVVTNNAIKPELSRLIGGGEAERARRLSVRTSLGTTSLALVCYGGLVYAGPQVMHMWSGGRVVASHEDLALVGLHAVFHVAWVVRGALVVAANRHEGLALVYVAGSGLGLLLWLLSAKHLEPLHGAASVLLAPEVLMLMAVTHLRGRAAARGVPA